MSQEPNLPPLPSIGDVLTRKEDLKEYKTTVIKCLECNKTIERDFQDGDYVHKKSGVKCKHCNRENAIITSIYANWEKPKEHRKRKEKAL